MLVALMGFGMPPSDAEVKVAAVPALQALPALTAAPRAELIPQVVDAARGRKEVTGALRASLPRVPRPGFKYLWMLRPSTPNSSKCWCRSRLPR
jgi:hypothetical protein